MEAISFSAMPLDRDPLDPLFERWKADTPVIAHSIRSEVWSRIERNEDVTASDGIWARIELAFSRPAFAAAFVTACVLLGLFLAEARLSQAHARRSAELEQSYLSLLDPQLETTAHVTPASNHAP